MVVVMVALGGATLLPAAACAAESPADTPIVDLFTAQSVFITQHHGPMRSPYAGENSLPGTTETRTSGSLLVSLGKQLRPGLQAYVDGRILRGGGLGNENGLAGYANGDFTGAARASGAYVQRAYLRGFTPLGTATESVERDVDRIAGDEPVERIDWRIGRLVAADRLDELRYANSPTQHFINLGLVNNPAWDNAQTGRGYTEGVDVALVRRGWSLRFGTYRMPRTTNGPKLDGDVLHARSDNVELTAQPRGERGPVVRVLLFRNVARMGNYRSALDAADGGRPDIVADQRPGRTKRGATANVELPIADAGETGLFACAGWNDGRNEDFSFTEVDRNFCMGAQIAGTRWGRAQDRVGLAYLSNALSLAHRDYLAAGGSGFQLGDGALTYGREKITEIYYRYVATARVELSPDWQTIRNPAFNRDRGPVHVVSLRVRLAF